MISEISIFGNKCILDFTLTFKIDCIKRIITFFIAATLATSLFAQAPQKMSYQAVVRDGNNKLLTNTQVGANKYTAGVCVWCYSLC